MRVPRLSFCAVALLAASATVASADIGRWHAVQNLPGCSVWNYNPQPDETVSWTGVCNDAKGEGEGILTWQYRTDGKAKWVRTTGRLAAGKLVGPRISVNSDGDRIEGDPNGRGVFTGANGVRYDGEFQAGKFNGRGLYIHADGSRYEGELRDHKFSGQGVLTWRDGNRFEGRFIDDQPVGVGNCSVAGRTGRCLITVKEIHWLEFDFRQEATVPGATGSGPNP